MAQLPATQDPWLGGTTARYTPKQREGMIDASIRRNGHRGCNCQGCRVHPGLVCPLWNLPATADVHRILTPHHGPKGPGDHHLSNVDAFCLPCNRAHGRVAQAGAQTSAQHTVRERERTRGRPLGVSATVDQSVRLVQRHEWERPAWDEWVVSSKPWKRLKQEGLLFGNDWALLGDLLDLAEDQVVDAIEGKGSSVTFRRYAMADRFSVLEMDRSKGKIWVRLRKEGKAK